jgi:hypothetical protein
MAIIYIANLHGTIYLDESSSFIFSVPLKIYFSQSACLIHIIFVKLTISVFHKLDFQL